MRAVLASLKAQNNTLHVTTERLVDTNSELMERLNRQSAQVAALQSALLSAQSAQATAREAPEQIPGMLTAAGADPQAVPMMC